MDVFKIISDDDDDDVDYYYYCFNLMKHSGSNVTDVKDLSLVRVYTATFARISTCVSAARTQNDIQAGYDVQIISGVCAAGLFVTVLDV